MKPLKKNARTAILLVFLLILLLSQFAAIDIRSFWEDEAVTGWLVHESFDKIIEQRGNNNHPPLYWLSAAMWSKIVGSSDKVLKIYSTVWLVLAFVLTYRLALDMFNERVALISVGLFALSPIVLTYGHNARYYSMAAGLSLLSTLGVYQYLKTKRKWWLSVYIIAGTLLIYSVYMGATILVALNIWWLIMWTWEKHKLSDFLIWGVAQIAIMLAYIPWFAILFGAVNRNFETITIDNWLVELIVRIGYLGFVFEVGEFISPLNPVAYLGIMISTVAFIYAIVKSSQELRLLLIMLLVVESISIMVNIVAVYPQSAWQNLSNRTFFIYPFFLIVLAYGITQFRGKWFPIALSALVFVYAVGFFNYFNDRQAIKPFLTIPWQQIMDDIQSRATEDRVVICTNDDTACFYYQRRFGNQRIGPGQVENIIEQNPSEIWWIQSNRIDFDNFKGSYAEQFSSLQAQYDLDETYRYVPHDPGISMLKKRFLGNNVYEYRVIVYKFAAPEE